MAGGLGGLGGFDVGSVLGALGQSLLVSPRENPFQGLPAAMQAATQQREHQASLNAMAAVAQKFGIPPEIAANPTAMQMYIQQANLEKMNKLRLQAAQAGQLAPPDDDTSSQPAMSVPSLTGAGSGPQSFNLQGGVGAPVGGGGAPVTGLDGPGGLGGASGMLPKPASFTQRGGLGGTRMTLPVDPALAPAIAKYSAAAGLNPVDVATAMSYETGGTFDPWKAGPTTKWGQHRGLIQWGEKQAQDYGVTKSTPVDEQVQAAIAYLQDRGVKPGMGLLDIYSAINAGRVGRYNASDVAAGGAPGTVRDKVASMGAHRQKAQALLSSVDLTNIVPTPLAAPTQTGSTDIPLPPVRPMQFGSADQTAISPPSAGVGQSGAPTNQVAAAGKAIPVPIPDVKLPPPPALPPGGKAGNATKAWARNQLQIGMNLLATSNGDTVVMKQAEFLMQRAAKYIDPSDTARRVSEAGLTGTPVGRAIIAGMPTGVVEKLSEQQVPGYESPNTLEQKKFQSSQDEQAYRRSLDEKRLQQQADIAEASRRPPEYNLGKALSSDATAATTRAGIEAKTAQEAAVAQAKDVAAARTKFSAEATGGAKAAEALIAPVKTAQQALENVVKLGGYGPVAGSGFNRALTSLSPYVPGHTAEIERQKFDQAIKTIGAAKAAVINHAQGGGNMSGTEQVLARADLPTLTSADPTVARAAFKQLNDDLERAIEADKRFGLYGGEQQAPRENQAAPAGPARAPKEGDIAVNPKTGARVILRGGKWVDAAGML